MAIQVPDIDRLREQLAARRAALARLDEPVQRSLAVLRETIAGAFDSEGMSLGAAWPPLAPRTLREKLRLGYPAQPLVRTGLLRSGWEASLTGPGQGTLRSAAPYARAHEEGLGVPQRRFLPGLEAAGSALREVFEQHVEEALHGDR